MKKILALLLALMMIVTVFAGCADTTTDDSQAEDKSSATADDNDDVADDEEPTDDGEEAPVPITLLVPDNNVPEYPRNMDRPVMQKMKEIFLEKFNVDWTLESVIGEKFEETVNTRLAAGTDLPDAINYRFGDSRLLEIYNNGLIIGLNDLIEEYGPNIKHGMMEEIPYLTIANGTADGEILRVPDAVLNIQHQVTVLNVRYDWIKQLGMEIPTTPEEFKAYLVACNDQDVNGTGNRDIIFLANYGNMNFSLGTSFGVMNASSASSSWWYDDDMKLYNSMATDNMRDYVAYVADLYDEGLIFPAFSNYTADQWNEVIYNNKAGAGVGAWWDGVIQVGTLSSKGITGETVTFRNLENADGESVNVLKNLGGYSGTMITKDCAAPEKVIMMADYFYTLEGSRLDYNGEIYPGGDYYVAVDESKLDPRLQGTLSEGQMEYTEKGQQAMAENPQLWNAMGFNTCTFGRWMIGTAGDIAHEFSTAFAGTGLACDIDWNLENLNFFIENGITQVGFSMPTDEQTAAINEYTDLFTYMDEQIQLFMMCGRDLSEWDAFVEECNDMGLADVTAIYQERFDAYVSVMDEMGAMVFEK
ncbi:MAG: hypothetical protein E7487_07295 [Ruminococcaceae bacterium]|nr:hypothetical protein [Oscillospiraceae bacterium]